MLLYFLQIKCSFGLVWFSDDFVVATMVQGAPLTMPSPPCFRLNYYNLSPSRCRGGAILAHIMFVFRNPNVLALLSSGTIIDNPILAAHYWNTCVAPGYDLECSIIKGRRKVHWYRVLSRIVERNETMPRRR